MRRLGIGIGIILLLSVAVFGVLHAIMVSFYTVCPVVVEAPKGCALSGTPLDDCHLHLCAFHVNKNHPNMQVEAHHYCMEYSSNLFQCVVMDNNKKPARLLGVEYVIPDEVYQTLSEEEKIYWHPHDYEVDAGLLVATNLKDDKKVMQFVRGTWGKTFHTWSDPKLGLPLGKPELQWAFTKDGQINPELIRVRDKKLGISTDDIRKERSR